MRILLLVPPNKNKENVVRDLLYGCWCKGKRIGGTSLPPLSILQIAAVLKPEGCELKLIDAPASGLSVSDLCLDIKNYDVVILSTSAMTWEDDLSVLSSLKKAHSGLKVILFGYYPTCNPKYLLSFPAVDIIVRSEPEQIIRDLIRKMADNQPWQEIKGISFNLNNQYQENPPYPFMENLDELPFIDRTLLAKNADYFNPIIKKTPYTLMLTSRGCAGECIFCTSPLFYGAKVRCRSVDNVLEELRLIKHMGYKEVFFRDELFTFSRERTLAICEQIIKAKLSIKWICSTRADFLDKELMGIMKAAGCHMLRMGVESGNQNLLDKAKKGINLAQVRAVFKSAKQLNIDTHAHLVLGIPGENDKTIKNSMRFVQKIDPTIVTYGVLIPYKGTELFENLRAENKQANATMENNLPEAVLSKYLTNFSLEQLERYVRKCYQNFYLKPGYAFKRLICCGSFEEFKRILFAAKNIMSFMFNKQT
ncbi:MAG: B12-binding domain-containing radical SAM protein [Candidatus Omnitrophica bacterium]|nr:B12-binding domain-containing radical SAM protein [Candidatus Omnitrophota bacterium]